MQRNKMIFNVNLRDVSLYLPFILFSLLFLVGVLIGNLTVGNFDFIKVYTDETFRSFLSVRKEGVWFNVLGDSAFSLLPVFVLIFLSGTSVIGSIVSPLLLFIQGLKYGFISGYLYFTYSLNGIIFNCLILLPCGVVSLLGLIVLCIESFNFSIIISKICIRSEKTINTYLHFKSYCIKSSATLISAVLGIICDMLFSYLFIGFFDF